jgi:hypothetical protein
LETLLVRADWFGRTGSPNGTKSLQTWVLRLAYGVVEIELGGKVPYAVVCVGTIDTIRVDGEECPIGGGMRDARESRSCIRKSN